MNEGKLLFLDVDGVIVPYDRWEGLDHLKRILDETGARVVLISTWRLSSRQMEVLQAGLEEHGISPDVIIGATPDLSEAGGSRAQEIAAYLVDHEVSAFAVLDDEDLLSQPGGALLAGAFARTNSLRGLDGEIADEVVAILSRS